MNAVLIQRARNGFIVSPFAPALMLSGNPEDVSVFTETDIDTIAAHLSSLLSAIPSVRSEVDALRVVLAEAAITP